MAFAILFIFFTCFISSLVRILCFLYFHTSPRPFSNQLPKATVKYVCPSARSKEQNIQTAVCKLIAPPFSTSSQVMCLIHSYEPFKWLCVFSFVSGWDHMRHKHKPNWEDNKQQSSWISYCCLAPDFAFAGFWTLGICSETFSWIAAGMKGSKRSLSLSECKNMKLTCSALSHLHANYSSHPLLFPSWVWSVDFSRKDIHFFFIFDVKIVILRGGSLHEQHKPVYLWSWANKCGMWILTLTRGCLAWCLEAW